MHVIFFFFMSKISDQEIVKRYSIALYELALEEKKHKILLEDLQKIKKLIEENRYFNKLLFSPTISSSSYKEILNSIFDKLKLDVITKNFLFLLSFNKRLMLLEKINDYFINVLSKDKNILNVNITLPEKISKQEIEKIQKKLELKIKNKTKLNFIEDKNIISGFIIKLGSRMLDYSLKTKLDKIEDSLR